MSKTVRGLFVALICCVASNGRAQAGNIWCDPDLAPQDATWGPTCNACLRSAYASYLACTCRNCNPSDDPRYRILNNECRYCARMFEFETGLCGVLPTGPNRQMGCCQGWTPEDVALTVLSAWGAKSAIEEAVGAAAGSAAESAAEKFVPLVCPAGTILCSDTSCNGQVTERCVALEPNVCLPPGVCGETTDQLGCPPGGGPPADQHFCPVDEIKVYDSSTGKWFCVKRDAAHKCNPMEPMGTCPDATGDACVPCGPDNCPTGTAWNDALKTCEDDASGNKPKEPADNACECDQARWQACVSKSDGTEWHCEPACAMSCDASLGECCNGVSCVPCGNAFCPVSSHWSTQRNSCVSGQDEKVYCDCGGLDCSASDWDGDGRTGTPEDAAWREANCTH